MRNGLAMERILAGVRVYFVWQSVPTYKYEIQSHPFAAGIGRHWLSKFGYEHMAQLLKANPQPSNFLWCADIQESLHEPLYVDAFHYSPAMS